MPARRPRILVLGYGNPARGDDGLGPALAGAIERRELDGVTVEVRHQMQIEDAAEVARVDLVVFVDAHAACGERFVFRRIEPRADEGFTSHALSPAAILAAAKSVLGAAPQAYVLGIAGREFEMFSECLSPEAQDNLHAALSFIEPLLQAGDPASGLAAGASTGPTALGAGR